MRIVSTAEKKQYLRDLRWNMESWYDFGTERFTGLVLGNFLYITHHAGFEWNRRITNEKSRAIGFVTRHGDGCAVNVLCFRGDLDPVSLVRNYLLFMLFGALRMVSETAGIVNLFTIPEIHLYAVGFSLLVGVCSAANCWFTERGQQGMLELLKLLQNPVGLFAYSEE